MGPLSTILEKLTPREREVVSARYGEDLTSTQTADRLRIGDRRVRQLTAAARKRLDSSGVKLPPLRRGRRAGRATAASQISDGMNLDTV